MGCGRQKQTREKKIKSFSELYTEAEGDVPTFSELYTESEGDVPKEVLDLGIFPIVPV